MILIFKLYKSNLKEVSMIKIFISHASEDKEQIAAPLAFSLRRANVDIWYDEFSLHLGDSLTESIEKGLSICDGGIIIISPHFLEKKWTERELSALFSKKALKNGLLIPILHNITSKELSDKKPMLGDLLAVKSDIPFQELVNKILQRIHQEPVVDLEQFAPTGIPRLDQILGGGLRRRSSIVVEGPKAIGKTTLGIQIQKTALERGESALFISYSETPVEIIHNFIRMGCKIGEFIEKGKFKILDNYSPIIGIPEHEVLENLHPLGIDYYAGIIRSNDPQNVEKYYKLHGKIIEKLGRAVNIIDSTNGRYELFGGINSNQDDSDKYFRRFKSKGTMNGNIGIHMAQDIEHHKKLLPLLGNLEHGVIRMKFVYGDVVRKKRMLQVEHIDNADTSWYEFTLTNTGIDIF